MVKSMKQNLNWRPELVITKPWNHPMEKLLEAIYSPHPSLSNGTKLDFLNWKVIDTAKKSQFFKIWTHTYFWSWDNMKQGGT